MPEAFHELPWPDNPEGAPRRVGVEIEMAGVSLERMAEAIRAEFGGQVHCDSPFIARVCDTEQGDFQVELDARVLKDRAYRSHLRRLGIELDDSDEAALDRWLADAAGRLVPHEIVAPPMAASTLPRLDRVRHALQEAGRWAPSDRYSTRSGCSSTSRYTAPILSGSSTSCGPSCCCTRCW